MRMKKTLAQIDAEIIEDACTRTTTSRESLRRKIDQEIQQYLAEGGRIHAVNGSGTTRDVFNRPISERSSRILENFDTQKRGRGR